EAQVGELANGLEAVELGRRAAESDLALAVAARGDELGRDESDDLVATLDHDVRQAPRRGIDHDVGSLADDLVGAAHRGAELEPHPTPKSPRRPPRPRHPLRVTARRPVLS